MTKFVSVDTVVSSRDFERLLRESSIPIEFVDFLNGGAEDERTLLENEAAFRRLQLVPRVLSGVSHPTIATRLLDRPSALPIFISPTGHRDFFSPDADEMMCVAAAEAGTINTVAWRAGQDLHDLGEVAGSETRWYQVYPSPDMDLVRTRIRDAERLGYAAVMVTLDVPVSGKRERDARRAFSPAAAYSAEDWARGQPVSATWMDFASIVEASSIPIIAKGILSPSDARLAAEAGASAVVVSNHGGRQLDGAVGALVALQDVVAEVGQSVEVYLDGGVRRGSDALKAIALGARAVGIGRPPLWALAVAGKRGVLRLFSLLADELERSLTLCGVDSIDSVTSSILLEDSVNPMD